MEDLVRVPPVKDKNSPLSLYDGVYGDCNGHDRTQVTLACDKPAVGSKGAVRGADAIGQGCWVRVRLLRRVSSVGANPHL